MIVFGILNAKYTAHPFRATCRHGYVAEGFLIAIKKLFVQSQSTFYYFTTKSNDFHSSCKFDLFESFYFTIPINPYNVETGLKGSY